MRIIRAPVLMVEQRVRDSRVWLIHADYVAPRRKLASCWHRGCLRRFAFFRSLLCTFLRLWLLLCRQRDVERGFGARDLNALLLEHAQELHLQSSARLVRGQ